MEAGIPDIAPTLLDLGGYDTPTSMQGKSLVAGKNSGPTGDSGGMGEEIVRERLRGLGYIS